MAKKICFTSLGCVRNLVDTEVMMGVLLQEGFEIDSNIRKVDFHIVNTCGFLKEAREEVFAILNEIFKAKKKSSKVIVTGCMVGLFQKELEEKFSEIYFFLGPGDIKNILLALNSPKRGKIVSEQSFLESCDTPRFLSTSSNFAYLKISEGCLKSCSYCLIPKIKGRLKSKTIEQVVLEFRKLLDKNVFEIILIAQDLGDYGKDLSEKGALERLLKEILAIKRDFRVRLLYLYPDSITDDLIKIISSDVRICKYVDIPIQHINDDILKRMRRNISKEKILKTIASLRSKINDIVIRTTLIVGFPGETEGQFHELVEFVKSQRLDRVGIFKYSNEEGTRSFDFQDQVSEKVKEERYKNIHKAQEKIVREKNQKMVGRTLNVFIESYHPDSNLLLMGRDLSSAPEIDPCVIINNPKNFKGFGQCYEVKITGFSGHDLIGEISS